MSRLSRGRRSPRASLLAATWLAGLLSAIPGVGAETRPSPESPRPWFAFTTVTIAGAALSGDRARAEWAFERLAPNEDVRISGQRADRPTPVRTEMLLVNGRAWLVRGIEPREGAEIDALDEPVLTLQLVLRLLEMAQPAGPRSVGRATKVEVTSKQEGIHMSTPSASGDFGPPLIVTGTLRPAGPERVAYRLSLRYQLGGARRAASFEGVWARSSAPATLADDFDVSAFAVYELGPRRLDRQSGTIVDYGATKTSGSPTLGEIRKRYPKQP